MRAWFNGRMEASQALDEGSIPFARSIFCLLMECCPCSSVVEHWSEKPGVDSSILSLGIFLLLKNPAKSGVFYYRNSEL